MLLQELSVNLAQQSLLELFLKKVELRTAHTLRLRSVLLVEVFAALVKLVNRFSAFGFVVPIAL